MVCPQTTDSPRPARIRLPWSATRRMEIHQSHIKIVTGIKDQTWGGVFFEGKVYRPGKLVDTDSLPRPTVAIELAGPVGSWQRGKHRELLYIVWRFDYAKWEWIEIMRTQDLTWRWTNYIRE